MNNWSEDLELGLRGYNVSAAYDVAVPYLPQYFETPRVDRSKAEPANVELATATSTSGGFGIGLDELAPLVRDCNLEALNQYNGVQGLSNRLKTDLKKGIDRCVDDLLQRRQTFGSNTYLCKNGISFWFFLWRAIHSPLSLLMVLAAVTYMLLRLIIGEGWYKEAINLLIVIVVIFEKAAIERLQYGQIEKLTDQKGNVHQEVIRGGRRLRVSVYDIVVGDIIPLKNGGQVPADGVLFEVTSLKIDEQEITASHEIVQKDLEKDPFLYSGSKLIEGIGTMMVTSVGMNTKLGLKMEEIQHETDKEKPFYVNLKWIAYSASLLVVLFALVAVIVQLCKYFGSDGNPMFIDGRTTFDEKLKFVIKSLRFGIATIIVAVPVGLFTAIPLNRANTARKMAKEKALVQTISACERIGYVTTIVCHKTGILTFNEMTVDDFWAGGMSKQDVDRGSQLPTSLRELMVEGIANNTNGSVVLENENGDKDNEAEFYGSPTEQAILRFGNKLGMSFDDTRSASSVCHTIPFNPKKKYGGVALQLGEEARVHWKGSAKIILRSCKEYMDGANNLITIDEQSRKFLEGTIESMCMRGMRCAALAYQPCELESLSTIKEPRYLVLLAIIGIKDSCRSGTRDTIQLCKTGGVKVCMVTEDDVVTAKAVAMECGILGDASGLIRTGAEFHNLSDVEREQIAGDILVLAQSSPSDVLLLVKALKERGDMVAATGMGIHDQKILLEADVGFAMGMGGTAAAKENSDIIILDDDIATIVKVILCSRSLYTNNQSYVLFRLTFSASAMALCVIELIQYDAFPLNVVQLLLLILILDIFGVLSLAYRPAHRLMGKPPVGIRDPLITKSMWAKIIIQVLYVVLSLVKLKPEKPLTLNHGHTDNAKRVMNTMIFTCFNLILVLGEFEIQSQTLIEILRENMFVVTVSLIIISQIIGIAFVGIFISTLKLDLKRWMLFSLMGLIRFCSDIPQLFLYNFYSRLSYIYSSLACGVLIKLLLYLILKIVKFNCCRRYILKKIATPKTSDVQFEYGCGLGSSFFRFLPYE